MAALFVPILAMIPESTDWSAVDKKRMLQILRAKGGPSERDVDRRVRAHTTFRRGLLALRPA